MTEVTLSATNSQACVGALVQAECENMTNFAVELNWNSDPSYNVNLQQHTLSVGCQQQQAPTDCPTCVDMGGLSPVPRSPAGTIGHNYILYYSNCRKILHKINIIDLLVSTVYMLSLLNFSIKKKNISC